MTRNNAKTTQNDLEYKCEKLASEKASLSEQLQQFQDAVNELQVWSRAEIEDYLGLRQLMFFYEYFTFRFKPNAIWKTRGSFRQFCLKPSEI